MLKVIREMADTISSLSADIIQWPAGDGVTSTTKGFQGMSGIHGVIGAVDGSHIPIKCPRVDHECYFNRKKFYSLVLQAVCDHEMRFTDVFVGWPGSAHDTTVFDDSDLGRLSATNPSALFRDGTHLLGDKAYCLTPTLLIPYKEGRDLDNSSERLRFNKAHSSTRIVIERAFGCMKGRFRRLMYTIDSLDLCFIVKLIQSGCVLHNIALPHDTGSFIEELCHEASVLGGAHNQPDNTGQAGSASDSGKVKRDVIASRLGRRS